MTNDKYTAAFLFQALLLHNGATLAPESETIYGFDPNSVFTFKEAEA